MINLELVFRTDCYVETSYDSKGNQINTTVNCGRSDCPQNG